MGFEQRQWRPGDNQQQTEAPAPVHLSLNQ